MSQFKMDRTRTSIGIGVAILLFLTGLGAIISLVLILSIIITAGMISSEEGDTREIYSKDFFELVIEVIASVIAVIAGTFILGFLFSLPRVPIIGIIIGGLLVLGGAIRPLYVFGVKLFVTDIYSVRRSKPSPAPAPNVGITPSFVPGYNSESTNYEKNEGSQMTKNFCTTCGENIQNYQFCPNCGAKK